MAGARSSPSPRPARPAPRPLLRHPIVRRLGLFGAYALAIGLTGVSVGGLVGIGGVGVAMLPGAGSAGEALAFGLGLGALVAGVYVASGVTLRAIFSATHRAEVLLAAPSGPHPLPLAGPAEGGDLSLADPPPVGGQLSEPPYAAGVADTPEAP